MRPVFVYAVFVAACGLPAPAPIQPPDPPPTQQVTAAAMSACANLRALHCPEGDGAAGAGGDSCEVVLTRRDDLKPLPLDCWAKAESVSIARGCGSLRCARE